MPLERRAGQEEPERPVKTVNVTEEIAKTRARALGQLQREGLDLPERPEFELPRVPTGITSMSDRSLMQLFVRLTRYQDHIAGELALAEINEHTTQTLLDIAKARNLAKNWEGTSDRVAVAKAEATLDPEVMKLESTLLQRNARRKLFGVLAESTARDAGVVSRELSRRIGREPGERRADRMTP